MEQLLEPIELTAVTEDDLADAHPVADGVVTPAFRDGRPDLGVVGEQVVHDRVGRQRRRAVPRERCERLALPRRDASGDRDRERPPSHYSAEGSASESASAGSADASGAAASSAPGAAGSSAASVTAVSSVKTS